MKLKCAKSYQSQAVLKGPTGQIRSAYGPNIYKATKPNRNSINALIPSVKISAVSSPELESQTLVLISVASVLHLPTSKAICKYCR